MKRIIFIPALAALAAAAVLLGACKATDTAGNTSAGVAASKASQPGETGGASAPTGTTTVHADGVRRVDVAELQKMVAAGGVVLYDTRSKMQYDEEHIEGARSLPQNEVEARAGELPRDKTLVFYCT
ncbi:MAG: rhodanese-like domain-containing protein [Pyrinomonadaceae bacterium]